MAEPQRYVIRQEPEPLFPAGVKYVAYREDGTPRYLAAETEQGLKHRLLEVEPNAQFVTPSPSVKSNLVKAEQIREGVQFIDSASLAEVKERYNVSSKEIAYHEVLAPPSGTALKKGETWRSKALSHASIMEQTAERIRREDIAELKPPVTPEVAPTPRLESVVDYDRRYTLEELQEMARQEGLSPSGSKKGIAARLIAKGLK